MAINGKAVPSPSTLVKNGDVISHTLHRHEPPVSAKAIGIVHEDDDIIVIDKPAGVPVHPAGRYNYNSIVEILRAERARGSLGWNPLPCNRLDRLTSGIMFIGKHARGAERVSQQIKSRRVRKEYIARVRGEFPEGDVECAQPILAISPKLGLNRVRANGKEARTVFRRLAYYPGPEAPLERGTNTELSWQRSRGYSIVRCLPQTGRTHQIRVHLQFLGHPISNDPIYSNQRVFGSDLAVADSSADADEDIIARLSRMGKDEVADAVAYHDDMVTEYNKRKAEKMTGHVCDVCQTPLYSDPGLHELGIYLHARRYAFVALPDGLGRQGDKREERVAEGAEIPDLQEERTASHCRNTPSWAYETDMPDWAPPPPPPSSSSSSTPVPTTSTASSTCIEGVSTLSLT